MSDLFSVIVLSECTVDGPGHVPLVEESVVLLRAGSEEEAEALARRWAAAEETSYLNEDGETVRWAFRELVSVYPLPVEVVTEDELRTGVEVSSRFLGDLDAYRAASGSGDEARWSPGHDDAPGGVP